MKNFKLFEKCNRRIARRVTLIAVLLAMCMPQAWAWIEISSANVYYDNSSSNWDESKNVVIAIERLENWANTDNHGCGVFAMGRIANTKLWRWAGSFGYNDINGYRFGSGATTYDWYAWWYDNGQGETTSFGLAGRDNWANVSGFYQESMGNVTKIFGAISSARAANLSKKDISTFPGDMNYTQNVYYSVCEGAGSYSKLTTGTTPAKIQMSSYKFVSEVYDAVSSETPADIAAGGTTRTRSFTAGHTATTQITVSNIVDGYEFMGWYDAASGGTQLEDAEHLTYTYYPKSACDVYARFRKTTYSLAGDNWTADDINWAAGTVASGGTRLMTTTDGITYSTTMTGENLGGSTRLFKIIKNQAWDANAISANSSVTKICYNGTLGDDGISNHNFTLAPYLAGAITVSYNTSTTTLTVTCEEPIITFSKDGGDGGTSSQKTYSTKVTSSVEKPSKTGYKFDGYWSDDDTPVQVIDKDGNWKRNISGYTDNSDPCKWSVSLNSNHTFTAHWTAKTYDITLDRQQGSSGSSSVTMTYNSSSHTSITAPTAPTGYTFAGWYSGALGTGSMVMNASGVLQANVDGYTSDGGIWTKDATCTLYAKYTATNYPDGYLYITDVKSVPETKAGTTITATLSGATYNASLNGSFAHGGLQYWALVGNSSDTYTLTFSSALTASATAAGVAVDVWWGANGTSSNSGTTVYLNGTSSSNKIGEAAANSDTRNQLLETLKNVQAVGTTSVTSLQLKRNNVNGAAWFRVGIKEIPGYKLTYDDGDGTGAPSASYQPNATITLSSTIPTYAGHMFAGWQVDGAGTVYEPGAEFAMPAEATTLVAKWEEICFTGSITKSSSSYTVNSGATKDITSDASVTSGGAITIVNNNNSNVSYAFSSDGVNINTSQGYIEFSLPTGSVLTAGSIIRVQGKGSSASTGLKIIDDSGNTLKSQSASTIDFTYTVTAKSDINGNSYVRINRASDNGVKLKSVTVAGCGAASCTAAPTVSTTTLGTTTTTTQVVNCAGISSLGTGTCTISDYGFVYGTSEDPTVSDNKVQVGTTYTTTNVAFDATTIESLTPGATYYVRAYATNGYGTAYGTGTSFTTHYAITTGSHTNGSVTIPSSAAPSASVVISATPNTGYSFSSWTIKKTSDGSDVTESVSLSGTTSATFTMPDYAVTVDATFSCTTPTITGPSDKTVCKDDDSPELSVSADANGGSLSYQWYSNDENNYATPVALENCTTATYSAASTSSVGTIYYYCVVTNTTGSCSANSDIAAVTVTAPTAISSHPSSIDDAVVGEEQTLTVSATGTGTLTYQWYTCKSDGSSASAISSATNESAITATLSITPSAVGTTYYKCVVHSECGSDKTSNVASILAKNGISPTLTYNAYSVAVGSTLTATLNKDGSTGSVTYISSNDAVATVASDGTVTGVSAGTVTITATIAATSDYWSNTVTSSTITVTAPTYDVTHTLYDVEFVSGTPAGSDQATRGTDYEATFEVVGRYTLPTDVTVTIGGVEVTKDTEYTWNSSTGELVVIGSYITGDIEIEIVGIPEPIPTLITYNLDAPNKETTPASLVTTSIVTVPATLKGDTLKNFTNVTLGSSFDITGPGKDKSGGTWTAKIGDAPSDSTTTDANSVTLSFDIHDDYELNVSSVTINVKSVTNGSQIYRAKLSDGISTVYGRVAPAQDKDDPISWGSFSGIKFKGSITLTLWVWGGKEFRLKTPIQIDGTLTKKPAPSGYAITEGAHTNGTIAITDGSSAITEAEEDATVHIEATPSTGYNFTSWTITKTSDASDVTSSVSLSGQTAEATFTMPAYGVTVNATFAAINYAITHNAAENGTYTISVAGGAATSESTTANYNQTVTLAATPSSHYKLQAWNVTKTSSGDEITVTDNEFTMPAEAVTIAPTFGRVYTVTFRAYGGSSVSPIEQTTVGGSITMPSTTTSNDSTFTGWMIGGTTVAAGASYTPTADVYAYAIWQKNCAGGTEVRFLSSNKNDAGSNFASMAKDATQLVGGGTAKLIAVAASTLNDEAKKIGYRADASNAKMEIVFKITATSTLDIYVNQDGKSNRTYQLASFTSAKSLSEIVPSDYTSASVVTTNVSTAGAAFASASYSTSAGTASVSSGIITITESGGIKISYSSLAAGYYVFQATGSSSEYIYGYDINSGGSGCFHITYDGNGADAGYENDARAYSSGDNAWVSTNSYSSSFTREGYEFNGWNNKADGSGTDYDFWTSSDHVVMTQDTTLYAQWRIIIDEDNTNVSGFETPQYKDVAVRNGATLTITEDMSVRNITVESGSTLHVAKNGEEGITFATKSLSLKGGYYTKSDYSESYDMPRVYIDPLSTLSRTNSTINFDIAVTNNFHPIAVPFPVKVSDVKYADPAVDDAIYGTHYIIKTYDGAARANGSYSCWTPVYKLNEETKEYEDVYLQPGRGYILAALRRVGKLYEFIRFPMKNVPSAWTTLGEQGTVDAVTKNVVAVEAYLKAGDEDGSKTPKANKGWNILGVPFMSRYQATDDIIQSPTEIIRGHFDYSTNKWDDDEIRYVTVPTYDFSEYNQYSIEDEGTILLPGWCFFVQVETSGNLKFLSASEAENEAMPIYAPKREQERKPTVKTGIILTGANAKDKTTILVSDKYNAAEYEINADLEKMFGDNGYTLATYTLSGETRLAYNAMNNADIMDVIPVGYRAPEEGEYSFSINPRYAESEAFEQVNLIDYEEGVVTNLLQSSYSFTTARTQNDARFAINVVKRQDTATDIETVGGEGINDANAPRKVLINDKMYIILDGKMYDATGKAVK